VILAADPGLHGALCAFDEVSGRVLQLDDMPIRTTKRRNGAVRTTIDEAGVIDWFLGQKLLGATRFICEQVSGLPGQSAPAAFAFGHGFGVLLMASRMLHYDVQQVRPVLLKAAMHVPSGADKSAAMALASELLPLDAWRWPLKKHDGRAEAALIALYGSRQPWA